MIHFAAPLIHDSAYIYTEYIKRRVEGKALLKLHDPTLDFLIIFRELFITPE